MSVQYTQLEAQKLPKSHDLRHDESCRRDFPIKFAASKTGKQWNGRGRAVDGGDVLHGDLGWVEGMCTMFGSR